MRQLGQKTALLVVTVLFCSSIALPQEKSDYEVIQNFKKKYEVLEKAIETAQTVQECVDIASRIDDLEKESSEDKKLLDKALYPDGYEKKFVNIRLQLRLTQEKLGIIQTQYARISELEAQVKALSAQVDKLGAENATLFARTQELGESIRGAEGGKTMDKRIIDSLTALVGKLRSNIRERDALIFALVDSLFMQYDKNVTAMKDVEKQGLAGKLERKNVFSNVKKSIEDNLAFLQSTALSGKDVVEMIKEQKKFESQWKAFGSKLAGLYEPGKKGANEISQIESMMADWGKKADEAFWRGLKASFKERGVAVKAFGSGTEFHDNLVAYLNDQIQEAKKGSNDERYNRFVSFHDSLWVTELKPSWMPLLTDGGKITKEQAKKIEDKVDEWSNTVRPPRTWLYIVIGLVVVVIVFALYRRMQRSKPVGA